MAVKLASEPSFGNLARQMGRLLDPSVGYFGFMPTDTWTPSVNLYESEAAYLVCFDLAGVEKQAIDLTVQDGRLRLTGKRKVPLYRAEQANAADPATSGEGAGIEKKTAPDAAGEGRSNAGSGSASARRRPAPFGPAAGEGRVRVHLMEIDHGNFNREVELPADVDKDAIAARFDNGLLWVKLPKT